MGFSKIIALGLLVALVPAAVAVANPGHDMNSATPAQTAKSATCKFETNDIGTITGRGPSSEDAFEDAATQCFEKRRALYRAKNKGANSDDATGELYIDVCVNLKCS